MALDPRLSLASHAPVVEPPDLLKTMLAAGQLREQQSIQSLRDLQAQRLADDYRKDRALEGLFQEAGTPSTAPVSPLNPQTAAGPIAQSASLGTPAQAPPLPGMVAQRPTPEQMLRVGGSRALPWIQQMQAVDQGERANQLQKLALGSAALDYLQQVTRPVTDQASLDAARQDMAQRAPGYERLLPPTYEAAGWRRFQEGLMPLKQKIELAELELKRGTLGVQQRKQTLEEQVEPAKVDLERFKAQTDRGKLTEQELTSTGEGIVATPKYPGALDILGGGTGQGAGQPRPLLSPSGEPIRPKEANAQELALQKEYNDLTKEYRAVRDAMGRITASSTKPTPAGDLSMIYAYMKMLDPQTGIRNEEVRNAAGSGGLPAQAQRWIEWAKGDQLLPDTVRADFLERSKMLYSEYVKDYEGLGNQYRDLAARQKLNPDNVVLDFRANTLKQPGPRAMTPQAWKEFVAEEQTRAKAAGRAPRDEATLKQIARQHGYQVP